MRLGPAGQLVMTTSADVRSLAERSRDLDRHLWQTGVRPGMIRPVDPRGHRQVRATAQSVGIGLRMDEAAGVSSGKSRSGSKDGPAR